MSDLVERIARLAYPDAWARIDAAPDTREAVDDSLLTRVRALAVARTVVADLRELAEPMRKPLMAWHLFNEPKLEGAWARAVDVFVRENGLEPPCGATGHPSVADRPETAPEAVPRPDGPILAPGGPLPARRTPGGHAA